jgi:nicotinamide mononucleotide adenylyltransferase
MSTCIFPGRFQPFHTGQLLVAKGMVKSCARPVIVVCHEGDMGPDDLFTQEQVREMITSSLLNEDIVDAEIVFVQDEGEDSEWADKILEAAGHPEEDEIWNGNTHVLGVFKDAGVATKAIKPVPGHVGEEIRQLIKDKDSEWRAKVPGGSMNVIDNAIGTQ